MKTLLLGALATLSVITAIPAAHAGNEFSFGVTVDESNDYDRRNTRHYRDYDNYDEDVGGRISCREGRRIVRSEGYRQIEAEKCEGRNYRYSAVRDGQVWAVRVNARSGQIVSERPVGYY